jgi:hypothetical protein
VHTGTATHRRAYDALFEVTLELSDISGAEAHLASALDALREVRNRVWQANWLSATGWLRVRAERYHEAVAVRTKAPRLRQESAPAGASSLDNLGLTHHRLGDLGQAPTCATAPS